MQQDQPEPTPQQKIEQVAGRYIVSKSEGTYDPLVAYEGDEVILVIQKSVGGHTFIARTRIPTCASLKQITRRCDELMGQMRRLWLNTATEFGWI